MLVEMHKSNSNVQHNVNVNVYVNVRSSPDEWLLGTFDLISSPSPWSQQTYVEYWSNHMPYRHRPAHSTVKETGYRWGTHRTRRWRKRGEHRSPLTVSHQRCCSGCRQPDGDTKPAAQRREATGGDADGRTDGRTLCPQVRWGRRIVRWIDGLDINL